MRIALTTALLVSMTANAATVIVDSTPRGAEVKIGEGEGARVVGKTPCRMQLPTGLHVTTISAQGYKTSTRILMVGRELLRHVVELEQVTYPVDILFGDLAEEGWAVFDGEKLLFKDGSVVKAPTTIHLAGKRKLRLLKPGYRDIHLDLNVVGKATVTVSTKPRKGRSSYQYALRSLVVGKWSHIYDGRQYVLTCLPSGMAVQMCPDGRRDSGRYTVKEIDGEIRFHWKISRGPGVRRPNVREVLLGEGDRMEGRVTFTRLRDDGEQ
jgi:hypothetical protein